MKKLEKVLVEAVIDEDGNVISAKATSGHPLLRQISEVAARASKFSRTKILGENVKANVLLTYKFKILKSTQAEVFVNYIKAEN